MNLRECIRLALKGIRNNKMRSFLTMLGVIIGVGAVIAMISIGEGAKQSISAQIQGLGSNLLIVMPGFQRGGAGGPRGAAGSANTLEADDVDAIRALSTVKKAAPVSNGGAVVKFANKSYTSSVIGTTPDYVEVRNLSLADGAFFTERDLKTRKKVAVIGPTVAEELFGAASPIGQKIKVGRLRFTVVGVTESKGQSGFTNNDDQVFIPLTTMQARLQGSRHIRTIYVEAQSEKVMDQATADITALLTKRKGSEDAFNVRNQAEILSTVQSTTQVFTLLLASIAGVSLLVGGIGIMNIMLVSVTERTREIGIRK
ncbi:MAG: ABC transporter permease, partial [Chitinophagales bacterium]